MVCMCPFGVLKLLHLVTIALISVAWNYYGHDLAFEENVNLVDGFSITANSSTWYSGITGRDEWRRNCLQKLILIYLLIVEAMHQKLFVNMEEAVETQLSDAHRRITAMHKASLCSVYIMACVLPYKMRGYSSLLASCYSGNIAL